MILTILREKKDGFWIVSLGEKSILENMKLAKKIRAIGIRCGMELESKSMKAQLRKADKFNPTSVLIRGENEIAANTIVIKNLDDSSQNEYNFNDWLETIQERI